MSNKIVCTCGNSESFRVLEHNVWKAFQSEEEPGMINAYKVETSETDMVTCASCNEVVKVDLDMNVQYKS